VEPLGRRTPLTLRRCIALATFLLAAFVIIKTIPAVRAVVAVYQDYDTLRPLLSSSTQELTQPANILKWEAVLTRSDTDLRVLRHEAGLLLGVAPFLGWVPYYGGDIAQAPALIEYASEAAATAQSSLGVYRSAMVQLPYGSELPQDLPRGELLLQVVASTRSEAEALKVQLDRTGRARQKIDIQNLSPRSAALLRRADKALALAGSALPALDLVPGLLGAQGLRRYLVLAQNNDELRATGGYISGIGVIEVQEGKVTRVSYQDSYTVENYAKPHPWPPRPLIDYMGAEMWVLRDANWSPDFPTTARTIEQLYELNQGTRVDGVIAINLPSVQRLVAALGPLDIPAFGERVDGANVLPRIEFFFLSSAGGDYDDWWRHRKDFMTALVQAMIARLNGQGGAINVSAVGQALWESLAKKDILIYLNDSQGAAILHELRWDGALPETHRAQDVVGVVDSNVGFSKADRKIAQWFDYRVELKPGEDAVASLRIRYENQNPPSSEPCVRKFEYQATYAELQNTCYWDYVRLYVPAGSRPIGATENISATLEMPEQGYTVMSGYFVLPRGQAREIRFDYRIPLTVRSDTPGDYSLTWIKQPGGHPAPVRVSLILPTSLRLQDAVPEPVARHESVLTFDLPTDRDTTISVRLIPASSNPPFALWGFAALAVGVLLACLAHYRRSSSE
jgi:hypothetical protein